MKLRRATAIDAPALAKVHVSSWREAYAGIVPSSHLRDFTVEFREESFRESLASGAEETYVAEHSRTVVGFLTLGGCRDLDVVSCTTGEIWGIYVSPEWWRKGIGRYLCEQGEAILSSRGYLCVKLWVLESNDQARAFYEAMGFECDGAIKQVNIGATLSVIRYQKRFDEESAVGSDNSHQRT